MLDLARKRIVLGLTGGIACYKIAELVRRMTEQGAIVDVVMTEAATHFITPVTMQALSGRPVFVDAWDPRVPNNMAHIDLTRGADAVLIAPASTDFMAKLAHGMADDLLSTLCVARACPLLVAPAMNREMWANPATQRNVAQLHADGISILGPAAGEQACGETGDGRMLEAHEILADLIAFFQPKLLAGRHVLLTAGPTSEPVDPVRVLSNRSSGKTGYALARAAREAGARVTLITGATALPVPRGVTALSVMTARQMHDAVMASAADADIFIAVAAVADWRVKNVSNQKLKKTSEGGGAPQMEFEPNPDILAEVAKLKDGPWCVGFAAETEKLAEHAEAKRQRKGIPLLVGNLAHKVMDADTTELVLFDAQGAHPLPAADKLDAARRLIAEIAARLPA
ncbi:bifunctional phosphopantothenoylcysteine decarboxylase/phosphopantothenate--cysteine ligase CoaBC [Achromobacter xylosoxidans]|uniref:bifunctional phosphopantothenoylcysteine decarboxylase/phosphopantothenate--cysteine ligase CoaBC n=1 Tax=Alcaligenes xylosoxydans xylosoxydans TaxID=85698 RepID=UPI001565D268|nr:bifunctional phosphopantothenoylcysteine decarboxylase/phosphopantothenate--cysteine ligase CoaBC [Achromobacter xylosoxidans]MCH1984877.1 bifunctional phosphopantothenoylcysteine decarboxylase/phosphopantothenate--cysteine ligase CoaBC [Achromobacter xylosoxidans]MCH4581692.1 bifunctional phosphopantothenoylcysteine decarboxylase/phosphopantothenate--cysteine ligase CoaBC [Achromobacter xylosoxidans]MCH4589278.1 bifunctional phosphopantothenoylcysteine decarboxylase/phosphopantothenate--cyst